MSMLNSFVDQNEGDSNRALKALFTGRCSQSRQTSRQSLVRHAYCKTGKCLCYYYATIPVAIEKAAIQIVLGCNNSLGVADMRPSELNQKA